MSDNVGGKIIAIYSSFPQQGKSEIRKYLVSRHKFRHLPFARLVKRMVYTLLIEHGYTHDVAINYIEVDKEVPLLRIEGSPTARHLMITLGTNWGRYEISNSLWLAEWESKARAWSRSGINIVADDLRFPNEAEAVIRLGGRIWRVERPSVITPSTEFNPTESNLDGIEFHSIILNDGSIEKLIKAVSSAVKFCGGAPKEAVKE